MNRRHFVSTLTGAAFAAAVKSSAAYALFQQAQPDPSEWPRSGPLLGHSEMTSTSIWLQTRRACRAQLRFWKRSLPDKARLSEIVETRSAADLIARFNLPQLEFGTKYEYELYLDGLRVRLPEQAAFQSQPMWRYRTNPPDFRVAVGSCAYINDSAYDRPGNPYGGNYEIFRAIAAERPDLMLWLGDNNYYREADWLDEGAMRHRMAHGRELPELRELFAATHHYAVWDDHDYGPNDSDRTFRGRDATLQIFKDYWSNASYGVDETRGVFSRFEWGDAEFFLLDGRYHRSPNAMPNPAERAMFGAAQMQWLMESLRSSNATFKIVAAGNQMLNPLTFYEAFGKCPAEQKQLLDFVQQLVNAAR
jgi:alkaline phosphatase D